MEEEEENDVFNKDLGRKMFGDTKHYCPVMLKEKGASKVCDFYGHLFCV